MSDRVKAFFESLSDRPLTELLADDVTFRTFARSITGRDDVVAALLAQDGGLIRTLTWDDPVDAGGVIRTCGAAPDGSTKLGYLVTVVMRGDRIAEIRQQDYRDARMAGSVRPVTSVDPIDLPAELKTLIDESCAKNPMLIAYVDKAQRPVLSFRGSVVTFSSDQLALWIRNPDSQLVRGIGLNPHVALTYRDQARKTTFQFQGRARVAADPADRQKIFASIPAVEQNHDFAMVGAALIIDLDAVEGYYNLDPGWIMLVQRRDAAGSKGQSS